MSSQNGLGARGAAQAWSRRNLDVSQGTINFNSGSQATDFAPNGNITAPKAWVFPTGRNAYELKFTFTLTGLFAQTLPANVLMSDPLWNDATNVWTPADVGTFEMLATFNGTNWFVKIVGLYV